MHKHVFLLTCILMLVVSGCANMQFGGEKEPTVKLKESEYNRLLDEKEELERKVAAMVPRADYDALLKEKDELNEKLKASEEKIEILEKEKEGEKTVLLFDGKIKYSVERAAVMDYEEVLVLTMLEDPEFKRAMDMGGKEADIVLIGLLKKITPDDRRITDEEIKAYLKSKKK
jgi:hypothetical protein